MSTNDRAEQWLMLAFPGDDPGHYALRAFAQAKNGKSWYRKLPTRDAAIQCKRELVDAGIKYKCIKVLTEKPRAARDNTGEFGGALNARPINGTWRRKRQSR